IVNWARLSEKALKLPPFRQKLPCCRDLSQDFESGASTSSATGAWGGIIVVAIRASTRRFRVRPSRGTFALLVCPATISTGPGTNGWPARSDATSVADPPGGPHRDGAHLEQRTASR